MDCVRVRIQISFISMDLVVRENLLYRRYLTEPISFVNFERKVFFFFCFQRIEKLYFISINKSDLENFIV